MIKPIALVSFFSSLVLFIIQFFTPFYGGSLPMLLAVLSVIVLALGVYAVVSCKTKEEGRWFAIAAIVVAVLAMLLPFIMMGFVREAFTAKMSTLQSP